MRYLLLPLIIALLVVFTVMGFKIWAPVFEGKSENETSVTAEKTKIEDFDSPHLNDKILPKLFPEPTRDYDNGLSSQEADEILAGAIVSRETLDQFAEIINQVDRDLVNGHYGTPGDLTFNIVYLFRQSLTAYYEFLQHPEEGPDLQVLFKKKFSGSYKYHMKKILLGQPTMGNREGRFLVTLFHEYQHYLFHTIYGTPQFTDIVHKFYNELAAHLFENLLTTYFPRRYFERDHRGRLPQQVKAKLKAKNGYAAFSLLYDFMLRGNGRKPLYKFLLPAAEGYITKEELLNSIDKTFHPNSQMALELQFISDQFNKK